MPSPSAPQRQHNEHNELNQHKQHAAASPSKAATATATASPSFFRRWTQEASNALSDMYGNLVLGDDAGGDCERLATILQPKPMRNASALRNSSTSLRRHSKYHPSMHHIHHSNNINNPNNNNSNNLINANNINMNSNLLHVEEILGFTVVEINGRSYIHSIVPNSQADKAGLRSQDCIQYAAVVQPSTANTNNSNNNTTNTAIPDAVQKQIELQALEEERRGTRIPHEQLVRLIQSNLYEALTDTAAGADAKSSNPEDNIPLTINVVGRNNSGKGAKTNTNTTTNANTGKPLQQPKSMVFVIRRTQQRKLFYQNAIKRSIDTSTTATTTATASSSSQSSPQHHIAKSISSMSSFSPYHWRMDDECDAAAVLIQTLMPNYNNNAITTNHNTTNINHDTAAIRTHIARAVGIAIVHASKLGMGVSVHGGSGIVIARLSDGTWSAPSCIGVWGMGIGVSVGVELARYLLVLPTQESLSHFIRGGSFTIGGTVGATVAGRGKETYGAASLSGNGSSPFCGSYDTTSPTTTSLHHSSNNTANNLNNSTVGNATGTFKSSSSKFGHSVSGAATTTKNNVFSGNNHHNHTTTPEDEYYHDQDGTATTTTRTKTTVTTSTTTDASGNITTYTVDDDDEVPHSHDNLCNSAAAASATSENKNSSSGICPLLAYTAQSQGFFVGVSLEGSRIICRSDMNQRAYKFATLGQSVTAHDILAGKVATPPEAESFYAALHALELAHEISIMKRPPDMLIRPNTVDWRSSTMTIYGTRQLDRSHGSHGSGNNNNKAVGASILPPPVGTFWATLSPAEATECNNFERQAKKFLYGGVSVQRIVFPNMANTFTVSMTTVKRQRRTLWLMLPEVGSLRLGFVSKSSDDVQDFKAKVSSNSSVSSAVNTLLMKSPNGDGPLNNRWFQDQDAATVDDELTLDSALLEKADPSFVIGRVRTGNVELSKKHSVALTDITLISQNPSNVCDLPANITSQIQAWDQSQRMVVVQDCSGTTLLFMADSDREAELIVCGLKLLLERETSRLGVRGGNSLGRIKGCATPTQSMSPATARGGPDKRNGAPTFSPRSALPGRRSSTSSRSSASSAEENDKEEILIGEVTIPSKSSAPEGWGSWGRVPGRNYMRGQAASTEIVPGGSSSPRAALEKGVPKYVHGQLLIRDVAKNIQLPLPLPLCRVLLLDSISPVISQWEEERGDVNFETTPWTFPPATPREMEHHPSEHQLIASGSMCGAHRTVSFERPRNGVLVRLSEMWKIDSDDTEKLAFTVTERMPRRGFSIKVKILLRSFTTHSCEATVLAELRPVGKNMANQAAVHKAFLMVLEELKMRYGLDGVGLLGGFLEVVNNMPADSKLLSNAGLSTDIPGMTKPVPRPFRRTTPALGEEKKEMDIPGANPAAHANSPSATSTDDSAAASGVVSFEEMLNTNKIPDDTPDRPRGPIDRLRHTTAKSHRDRSNSDSAKRIQAKRQHIKSDVFQELEGVGEHGDAQHDRSNANKREDLTVEVKPLPKIRLSLMPSPREEDEDKADERSTDVSSSKKSKKKLKKAPSSLSKKSSRSSKSGKSSKSGRSGWKKMTKSS